MSRTINRTSNAVPPTRYEDDLYSWVEEQVALLRAGRLSEVDALNVAEELSDVGRSEFHKLQSAIAVLALHLLKWDQQPAKRSRSWMASVNEQRRRINQTLEENPGLKTRLVAALKHGYAEGRDRAVADTNLDYDVFPEICPYAFDEMMTRRIVYEPTAPKKRKKR